jgi:hypothetical protein
MIILKIV